MTSITQKIRGDKTARTLIANFSYLSIIEIISILLPLVSYPYLIRVVGAQNYGIVVFAQAVIAYITIIVNFGFNVSATKRISENRHNIKKISVIYSSVIYQKAIIFALCTVLVFPILYIAKYEHSTIVIGLFGLCIQEILYPTWLYQGLENMKYITIITFFSKCSFLLLMFLFIRDESDYIIIPLLYSFGGILTSILSLLLANKHLHIKFVRVSFEQIKADFIESVPFFASRLSSVVMERTNIIAIGAFFSYEMVSVYDLCCKVVSILKTPFSLLAQVIYPNVSKSKDMTVIRKIIKPLFFVGFGLSTLVVIFSKYIVLLLGGERLLEAVTILQIMIWYIPIVGFSYLFGASVLIVKMHSREYNLSVIYSVILYMILMGCAVTINCVNLITMSLTFVLPELYVAFYRIHIASKYQLLK